jgi:hypothetical protein
VKCERFCHGHNFFPRFAECNMLSFVTQDGENLTREQIEDEIRKIKNAPAEDKGTYYFPEHLLVLLEITGDQCQTLWPAECTVSRVPML